ncbi:THAP domain-containing protein 1-like [Ostrinia furnacalis]|uniref:THAP domain-containing protein 1-like n=1 Tax=Ostrinia furnacalis TaxID=93504 RepID=UPI0010390886|nr:THAP domain-containing protein 1-like [Ostrinia furnacalis]
MVNCSVSKCRNRSNKRNFKNDGISYHLFPRIPGMRRKWQEFCNRGPSWQPFRTSTICSEHFEPAQFQRGTNRRFLVAKAIPTIYPAHMNEHNDEGSDDYSSSDQLDQKPQSPAGSEPENGQEDNGSQEKESDDKEKTTNNHHLRIQLREKRLKIHRLIQSNRYLTEKVEILQNILKRVINKSKYVKHRHKNGFK